MLISRDLPYRQCRNWGFSISVFWSSLGMAVDAIFLIYSLIFYRILQSLGGVDTHLDMYLIFFSCRLTNIHHFSWDYLTYMLLFTSHCSHTNCRITNRITSRITSRTIRRISNRIDSRVSKKPWNFNHCGVLLSGLPSWLSHFVSHSTLLISKFMAQNNSSFSSSVDQCCNHYSMPSDPNNNM